MPRSLAVASSLHGSSAHLLPVLHPAGKEVKERLVELSITENKLTMSPCKETVFVGGRTRRDVMEIKKQEAPTAGAVEAEQEHSRVTPTTVNYNTTEELTLSNEWLEKCFQQLEEESREQQEESNLQLAIQVGGAQALARYLQGHAIAQRNRGERAEKELHIVNELLDQAIEWIRDRWVACDPDEHIFDPRDNKCLICEVDERERNR